MKRSKLLLVVFLIGIVFVGNLIRYSYRVPRRHYCDFRVYYATGARFLDREDVYARPDQAITPFKYSPTVAMLFAPLSLIEKHEASLIFFAINFLSVIGICFLSRRLVGTDKLTYKQYWFLFFIPILFASRFIILVLDSGQVNLIMFLLVLLSIYFLEREKPLIGAPFLALSMLFKYMPIVFLPYFFFRKKYKFLTYVFLCLVVLCFLPSIVVGIDQNVAYLKSWIPSIVQGDSFEGGSWYDNKNQSLYSMVLRYVSTFKTTRPAFFDLSFYQGLLGSLVLGAFIYLPILFYRGNVKDNNVIDYSLLFICMAIFNPNAWMVNFVVYLFVYIYISYYLIRVKFKDKITLSLFILSFILTSWTCEAIVGNDLEIYLEELSVITISAIVLFAGLLRLKFKGRNYEN